MEEVLVENPSTLCRVCLNPGNYQLSTEITVDNVNITLDEMLMKFSALETNDNIPAKLCFKCISELGDSYMFMEKVKRADECIRNLFVLRGESDQLPEEDDDDEQQDIYEDDAINSIKTEQPAHIEQYELIETDILEPVDSIVEKPNMLKRPTQRSNKKPNIVLTNTVSHIFSRIRKNSVECLIEEVNDDEQLSLDEEPPAKRQKTASDHGKLLVTKFVLQPYKVPNSEQHNASPGPDLNNDLHDNEPSTSSMARNAQTVDLVIVEVDCAGQIIANDIGDDSNVEDPNRVYMCKFCPKAFSTSHHLLMHTRKSHVCLFCTRSFTKVEELHRHSKEEHTSFHCSLCEKHFSTNSNLRLHLKKFHEVDLPPYVTLMSMSTCIMPN